MKLTKCKFCYKEIKFLGHKLDAEGIHTLDDKIEAVKHFPVPTNVDEVRQYLGLCGYYRSFVKDFSRIAEPLFKLLKKQAEFRWSDEQTTAFNQLKDKLTHAPCLAYPNFSKKFIICTDASMKGLGAVLMQHDKRGKLQPIAFASRQLKGAEKNYCTTDLEGLGVVVALQKFRDIIYGYEVHLYTDHKPLLGMFQDKLLNGRRARWKCTLQNYNVSIHYIKGKIKEAADALSRNPTITYTKVATLKLKREAIPTLEDVPEAQRKDPLWSKVIYALESGDDTNTCVAD